MVALSGTRVMLGGWEDGWQVWLKVVADAPSAPPPGAKQGNGAIGFPIGVLRCVVTGALRCMGAEIPAGCIDVGANGAGTGAWIIAILFRYAAPGGGTTNCGGGIVICTA